MNPIAKPIAPPLEHLPQPVLAGGRTSLFEEFDWLYILFRERFFRDDTRRIIRALWPSGRPAAGTSLVELGCGPGFYSRRFARLFPGLDVLGLDCSARQLDYARGKAARIGLRNCRFEYGDVLEVTRPAESFDYVLASRLFTILDEADLAAAEIFRVLRPGGSCFVAEPRFHFWASLPLYALRLVARASGRSNDCHEPGSATIFSTHDFESLLRRQPWRAVRVWQDGRYHYALCQKE